PPAPGRISMITFFESLGSRSTIARRISSSSDSIRWREDSSNDRSSGSSPSSASSSLAPSRSSTARRYSVARRAAGSSSRYELLEVGLAGGEPLELEPGIHDRLDPVLAPVAPRPLDHLERQSGDQRHAQHTGEDEEPPGGQTDRREHEDGHDHHDQEEARSAA